jgi:carbon starvation protein
MYLALPIFMGLLMRYAKLSLGWATLIFLPLVGVAIWAGKFAPVNMEALLMRWEPDPVRAQALAVKVWDVLILAYCFAAALVPVWLLLQPRGHLGGFFLYAALLGGGVGLVLRGAAVKYPAIVPANTGTMFPMMFIMIACGACSGFHALVSSGTSSKQLARETDARVIGYGAMLLEALVAVVSLSFVMMLPAGDALTQKPPNFIYASGLGGFLGVFGIPATFGVTFGLLAFTTFVYDTLDVCTRLGRYIIEELTGWKGWFGKTVANLLTAGVPLFFVMRTMTDAAGKPVPAWKYFWTLFGASNQLMASLALLCVTVWLARTSRFRWAAWVTGLPMAFMYVTTMNALVRIISGYFLKPEGFTWTADPVPWIAIVLVVLAAIMLVEAAAALLKPAAPSGGAPVPAQA